MVKYTRDMRMHVVRLHEQYDCNVMLVFDGWDIRPEGCSMR